MQDSLSKPFRHAATYYLRAFYLGIIAAFIIALIDMLAVKSFIMPLAVILISLICGGLAYLLGYYTGRRGHFISLIMTLPLVMAFYWTPEAIAATPKHEQEFIIICPMIFFILTTIGQALGQWMRISAHKR